MLSYAVYLINTLYRVKDNLVYVYDSICDIYATKTWVFTTDNAYPVVTSSSWKTRAYRFYSPETHQFKGDGHRTTVDSVTAELHGDKVYDLSSFFYSVKWSTPPSLYELVLLYLMHEKICISTAIVDSYILTIMDSNGDDHTILLSSTFAKDPFYGFEGLKVD